jgi:hypothetical protein
MSSQKKVLSNIQYKNKPLKKELIFIMTYLDTHGQAYNILPFGLINYSTIIFSKDFFGT